MIGRFPDWKRTQFAVAGCVFVWFAGTSFVLPFLPLYVRELGGLDVGATALWSGFILASTPLLSGLLAPVWGALADRFGRKLMMQRSLLGFAACLGLMGIAQTPWHLLAIRGAMGFFGGFSSVAAALVAGSAPADKVTSGVGRIHAARVLGLAVGPLPGGILADTIGYRGACFASMSMGIAAFLIVTAFAREQKGYRKGRDEPRAPRRAVLLSGAFVSAFATVAAIRLAERSFDPVLPLLVAEVGASGLGVASTTAVIASAGLFAAALAAALTDRAVGGRSRNQGLRLALLAAALGLAPLFFASAWWQLLALRVLVGLALGVAITLTVSGTATETPAEMSGLALGLLGAGAAYGSTAGFLLSGLLGPISLALVFVAGAGLLVTAAGLHVLLRRRESR